MLGFICIVILLKSWSQIAQSQHTEQQQLLTRPHSDPFEGQIRLNFSSSAPHLFSSTHGLLRQGYNTFFSSGHAVVPCQIPAFTPLFHGWLNEEPPQSPEWLAFTPDMAYAIMGSTRNSFLSTYQTTRSIKCLYFDGASAALGERGTMDTQMLLVYGNTTGLPSKHFKGKLLWDEYDRAQRLCEWIHEKGAGSLGYGIEGIVRMNTGFEIIWCNFSSPSLQLVSRVNVSVPLLEYNRTSAFSQNQEFFHSPSPTVAFKSSTDFPVPEWKNDWEHEPFIASQEWDWLSSASRSYSIEDLASHRELGIRLLDGDFINFYSPEYLNFASTTAKQERQQFNLTLDGVWKGVQNRQERKGALEKLMRRRSKHRVGDLSQLDVTRFHQSLTRIVSKLSHSVNDASPSDNLNSNVPWSYLCDRIVDNYSKRLMQFQQHLDVDNEAWTSSSTKARKSFILIRERSHTFLMPFLEYPIDPHKHFAQAWRIKEQAHERCKYMYLPRPVYTASHENPSFDVHHPFRQAIEEVMDTICSVLISIGYSIEKEWIQTFNNDMPKDDGWKQRLQANVLSWQEKIEELTAWLGWAPHWIGCDRLCSWDEECYIPMWPVYRQLRVEKPSFPNFLPSPEEIEYDLWHPRCLKITDFPSR